MKYEGFPAIFYSRLWLQEIFGKLRKNFTDFHTRIVVLVTDSPPATLIEIDNGTFQIEILANIKDPEDLEMVECDTYLALSSETLLGGVNSILKGITEGHVKLKNPDALQTLGRIMGEF